MRRALADMRPDRFEDIHRAGGAVSTPVSMAKQFRPICARKHGAKSRKYLTRCWSPILKENLAFIILPGAR